MPGNYNCYECKKTELEKAKSEFDQCLEKIREERKPVRIREDSPIQIQKNKYITRIYKSLEASVYNQCSSLEKISEKVFKFDEQKLNEVFGKEKEKFFSELKSFQKEFQEDKIKDYWLSMFIRLLVEQKKKNSDNEFIKLFSLNTVDNSVHDILIDILCHGIKAWGDRIEIRNFTNSDKLKKLKNRSMRDEKILFKKIQEKIYERINDKTILRDQWIMLGIDFLFEFIFNDRNFWKAYYDSTRQCQEVQIMEVSRRMNPEAGICVRCEEKESYKLKGKVTKMICGDKNAIFWYMPENIEDFFEYNFNRYSYYRCYLLLMSMFWQKEERGFYYNTGYTRYFEWEVRLRADVTNIFRQWISLANNQNICMSLYKDVFATIFSVARRYKGDQLTKRNNLELRLCLIRSIDKIVKDVMMSVQIDLKTALEIISEQVEIEAKSFNEKYEKILDAAVYLFSKDNQWENVMWIKDTPTEELTRVIKRFEELKSSKTEKTYVGRKFNDLYDATSKKEKHGFFTDIWKAIRSSNGYNLFEKYKDEEEK